MAYHATPALLVQGGELFTHLRAQKGCKVNPEAARFYGGCVLLGLEYLHKRGLVYRDLKPENAAIDSEVRLRCLRRRSGRPFIR